MLNEEIEANIKAVVKATCKHRNPALGKYQNYIFIKYILLNTLIIFFFSSKRPYFQFSCLLIFFTRASSFEMSPQRYLDFTFITVYFFQKIEKQTHLPK